MEGIKYVQKNRLVVDTSSVDENAPLQAEGSNAIVTDNEIWFDPSIIDISDLNIEEQIGEWNASSHGDTDYPPPVLNTYRSRENSELNNQYGFVCGVISYRTSEYVIRTPSSITGDDIIFYEGDDKFWSLLNSRLDEDFQSPLQIYSSYTSGSSTIYYRAIPDLVGWAVASRVNVGNRKPITNAEMTLRDSGENHIGGEGAAKLRFYNRTMILAPGQLYNTYQNLSFSTSDGNVYSFRPNFTGNNGVLPVGLVMLRDIVDKTKQAPLNNLNNFGIYGFTIVMPIFLEPSQVVRGFSLGKEIFVVGNGLKVEVFFAISKTSRSEIDKSCGLSNRNLGDGQPGRLDVLFRGGNGELLIGNQQDAVIPGTESNTVLNCTNIYHDVVDFSVSGACNGAFYFTTEITYDMGVKYLVFGMRPYDINGNGKEYPPKSNPYGTDTSYLGNYALIDITDKKFYLL